MAIIKYFIERRFIKVVFSKKHNPAGGVSTSCKIALPKRWMDVMELSENDRQICIDFDPEKKTIVIRKAENQDEIILSKALLKEIGANTNSDLSYYIEDGKIKIFKL
ncbi:MAG: hypothetical protein VZQ55_04665 [Ruminococcus sp.]|nr:hypothetical protein [Ruminococcus sp.]